MAPKLRIEMDPHQILEELSHAGAWLRLTTLRQAFEKKESLIPVLLDAVQGRAKQGGTGDVYQQRLATFGVFFLAQHREKRLLGPIIDLLQSADPQQEDEWLFAGRLHFFGHRLIAGARPADAKAPMDLVLNTSIRAPARNPALCAIGLQAAYGDISRAEAVACMRELFKAVKPFRDETMDACWVRSAAKVHSKALERELQWFLASGRLDRHCRTMIAGAMRNDPAVNFFSIVALEPMVDLFSNVFEREIRDGEVGLLPNAQIPSLELFTEQDPELRFN
jgi:hypothetical protein